MKTRYWISLFLVIVVTAGGVVAQENDCDLDNVGALDQRADNYYDTEQYELAIRDLTCALALSPEDLAMLNKRGLAYWRLGELGKAVDDFNRAMEIDPEYSYVYNNRGNVYYDRGDYEKALADYDRAIELNPEPKVSYRNRGQLNYELGNFEQALADLNSSIEVDNTYGSAYIVRAWVYLSLGDRRAYADFARWLELMAINKETFELDGSVDGRVFTLDEGKAYYFVFSALAGQQIRAEATVVSGADADPLLVLFDADGVPITADDDSGMNVDAVITDFVIPADSTYTLVLGSGWDSGTGEVALTLDLGGEVVATFSTYKLFVNEKAEVYTTERSVLNVREGPGLDFDIITTLDRGALVTLLDGPRKADGYAWWRIRTADGIEGWAVERVEDEQTLTLALLVGEEAVVTSGNDLLNVRTEPARSADLAFQIEDGARVTLLEAPVIADGYRWWKIRTADAQEGFTIDRFGGERMLTPAREFE